MALLHPNIPACRSCSRPVSISHPLSYPACKHAICQKCLLKYIGCPCGFRGAPLFTIPLDDGLTRQLVVNITAHSENFRQTTDLQYWKTLTETADVLNEIIKEAIRNGEMMSSIRSEKGAMKNRPSVGSDKTDDTHPQNTNETNAADIDLHRKPPKPDNICCALY